MHRYLHELRVYWADARTVLDFLRLMQVRLSLSKVGRLTTPRRVVRRVNMRSFGGPVYLRSHTSDISVLKEQLISGAYEAIERYARAVDTVVDLGANTGLVARWILHRHPAARIVCVEPEPGNLELLERNLEGRGAIVPACVGASEGTASLATNTGEWGFRMSGEPGDVPVTTMDRVLAEHDLARVDVLKCDIEGAEAEVFADAPWMERVSVAVVECHGFPAEEILPDGWVIAERDGNPKRPHYETATFVRAA